MEIFVKGCPLILTGLGCAVAFRTGFFNIGAEGQFYVGAIVTTMVSLYAPGMPPLLVIILALACGFVCGGLWALIAAILKARFNLSEIIVTIMLNYMVINFLGYALRSFLMDKAANVPQSEKIDVARQIPVLVRASRFHAGILLALVCVAVVWFLMQKTTLGYELKAVGLNRRAAAVNGIPVVRTVIYSAFLSGGLAALAGGIEVLAIQKKLIEGISANCGYTAVLIALIARNKPWAVLVVSLLYAALQVQAGSWQRQSGVPSSIVNIFIGLIVILILAKDIVPYFRRKEGGSNAS
jgi:simple sugar transport system permease protein